ncbi:hypothetical protein [Kineosporia sp. NBRC 101731]|uniref:OmpL47-type beta-barrel domain-containing protein n=1 Tax=Kineosporia sp. NBRC 101731 TaxID=3032199 RepID=UPI0024A18282|nr:hypothetical protein [Kineosporia sp. NBRC 101731]GLY29860.1 hypothetical protein Kisp02_32250 [Kineosporia sp. NBRC 101731]
MSVRRPRTHQGRRRIIAGAGVTATAAGILVGLNAFSAQGFAPTRALAYSALGSTSHTSMTDTAVEALDKEFFGISDLTETMKDARNEIHDANAEVDEVQTSERHFDSEDFGGSQARLIDLVNQVKTQMDANNTTGARESLGGALHTLQDFYSHTNWIELGRTGVNTNLGKAGASVGKIADPTENTCDGSTLIGRAAPGSADPVLTSGYYKINRPGKCRHGGALDTGSRVSGINKDTDSRAISPHDSLHPQAAAMATEATQEFIRREIKSRLSEKQLAALFGVGPTLGFAIDDTGSMGGVIESVKNQATTLVDARLGTPEEPRQYVLSPFNDPSTGPLTVTDDAATFKSAISSVYASGGGDCPELSMTGQLAAVNAMDKGGTLFSYTDADAKDAGLADLVAAVAKDKDITVHQMMFGSCSGPFSSSAGTTRAKSTGRSGQEPAPKLSAAARTRDDIIAAAAPETNPYVKVARATGGQVFDLSYGDADVITQLADAVVHSDLVDVLSQSTVLSPVAAEVPVPVDSRLGTVTFSVASTGSLDLEVVRPDGSVVTPADPGVTVLTPSTGTTQIVTVVKPAVGAWKLRMTGDGTASTVVSGRSNFSLESATFVAPSDVAGDPEVEYQGPIDGAPAAGQLVGIDASLGDDYASAAFELRRTDGTVISKLKLTEFESEFFGTFTTPSEPFRVFVTGKDKSGSTFVRDRSDLIAPATLAVTAPDVSTIPAGVATKLAFNVHNYGSAGSFTTSAVDASGYVTGVEPNPINLASGADGKVTVTVTPPAGLTGDALSDALTVTVARTDDRSVSNYAVLNLGITTKDVTAPTTTVTPDPAIRDSGWATADTTLTLKAADAASGVQSLSYSVSGQTKVKTTTVKADTATIRITKEGVSTVVFQAIDKDGNVEEPQTYEIKLDKTAPSIDCSPRPKRLKTSESGLIPIEVSIRTRDKLSGPGAFSLTSVTDNQGSSTADIVGWETGKPDTQGKLRATQTRGSDRVYTLNYQATDVAGNIGTCSTTVTVDHRIV